MSNTDLKEELAKDVEAASLERIEAPAEEESDEASFADLVEDIIEGDIEAEEFDNRVKDILASLFDIPYVPDALEARLLGFGIDAVKAALIQVAKRFA